MHNAITAVLVAAYLQQLTEQHKASLSLRLLNAELDGLAEYPLDDFCAPGYLCDSRARVERDINKGIFFARGLLQ
jgi:hypothetical protein